MKKLILAEFVTAVFFIIMAWGSCLGNRIGVPVAFGLSVLVVILFQNLIAIAALSSAVLASIIAIQYFTPAGITVINDSVVPFALFALFGFFYSAKCYAKENNLSKTKVIASLLIEFFIIFAIILITQNLKTFSQ